MYLELILVFAVLLAVLLVSPVDVQFDYKKNSELDCLTVTVYLFGFWKIYQEIKRDCAQSMLKEIIGKFTAPKEAPGEENQAAGKPSGSKFKNLSWRQLNSLPWTCRKLALKIKFSSDDAAWTAISFGIIHLIKSLAYQRLRSKICFKTSPDFIIEPSFHGGQKELLLKCIIRVKFGNIVYILKN